MKRDMDILSHLLKGSPLYLIDVGALDGLKYPWGRYKQILQSISFEPQEDELPLALFNDQGKNVMWVTRREDSTSLLRPNRKILDRYGNSESFDIVKELSVTTDTLDSQTARKGISFVDFIKLDTQGSELSILQGAVKTLETSVFGIEVEVNFVDRYQEQAHFGEVDLFLRQKGFELFDIQSRYHKRRGTFGIGGPKGQLTHGTALYYRTLESAAPLISGENAEIRIMHFICSALVYGYHDFARDILDEFKDKISKSKVESLKEVILRKDLIIPSFPGKYKLNSLFRLLSRYFTPYSPTGKTGDYTLGNLD